ncbi:MAG: hypothetical protein ABI193_21010 [Minicystis sp.]
MIRRSLTNSILVALSLLASSALAQDVGVDEVTLKNGGSIRGTVISSEPGTSVKILEMGAKEPRVIPWAQVGDVEKGKYAPKSAVQPGSAGPGYGAAIPDEPAALPPPPAAKLGAPGVVKLHIDSPVPVQLLENTGTSFAAAGGYGVVINQFRPVCAAPCDTIIDGSKGQQFGIVGKFPAAKPVTFLDQRGEVKLTVKPGSVAASALGWVGVGLGVGAVTLGAIYTAVGPSTKSTTGLSDSQIGGIGALAGGGVLLVGGIISIALSGTSWKLEPAAAGKSARLPRYWMGEL